MECDALQSDRSLLTFQRNLLLPACLTDFSTNISLSETSLNLYQVTLHLEDSSIHSHLRKIHKSHTVPLWFSTIPWARITFSSTHGATGFRHHLWISSQLNITEQICNFGSHPGLVTGKHSATLTWVRNANGPCKVCSGMPCSCRLFVVLSFVCHPFHHFPIFFQHSRRQMPLFSHWCRVNTRKEHYKL